MSDTLKIIIGVGCGVLLALAVVFGVLTVGCTACVASVGNTLAEAERAQAQALSAIEFEDTEGVHDGDWFKVKGYVRNTGSSSVSFVKIGIDLLDANGKVLDQDWTFAVAGEGLGPGDRKSFETMTPAPAGVEQFRYYVKTD